MTISSCPTLVTPTFFVTPVDFSRRCLLSVVAMIMKVLVSLLFFFGLAFGQDVNTTASTCGGNCPGSCGSCPCGTTKNTLDIATWCSKYSGWKQSSCQCIMSKESGGNANAVNQNGSGGSYDVGLWQINDMNWASCNGGKAPCDPSANLNCAKMVFGWGGNTWKYWSTCSACGVCNSS